MKNKNLYYNLALFLIAALGIAVSLILSFSGDSFDNSLYGVLFILPSIELIICVFSCVYPLYKVKKEHKDERNYVAPIILLSIFTIMQILMVLQRKGHNFDLWKLAIIFFGFLVSLAGNYYPKSKTNDIFAIYNPWTIANKTIWRKTHRFAGYLWMFGGICIILTSLLSNAINLWIALGIVFILLVGPTLFSMFYFKSKVKRND